MLALKDTYINYLVNLINIRCSKTKEHIDEYRPYLSNNRNLANFNEKLKELIFTMGVRDAEGAYFTDLNDNQYLDFTMGFGVHLFGHKVDFLEKAIVEQLKKGIALGPLYREAAEVSKLIQELTSVERCAFYNSGTEAVMVAMRIARAVTQKNKVIIFEGSYHGTHDSLLAMKPDPSTQMAVTSILGVTQNAVDNTIILKYGEQDTLDFITQNANEVAAVLTEPVMSRHPELVNHTFLKELRTVCTKGEVALIFDEVITGFRLDNGGAAKLFGIVPDIVTYGKILGGGLSIGVVAGKGIFLDAIDGGQWKFGDGSVPPCKTTFTAGTFNHHPLAMAAAKATLIYLKKDDGKLQKLLNEKTKNLCHLLNTFFQLEGFPISMVYFGSLFRFKLTGNHKLIFYSLLKESIYIWEGRNCYISTAHSDKDLLFFIGKVKKCCFELVAAGILKSKNTLIDNKYQNKIQAAIELQSVLDKKSLEYVSKYLFASISNLKSVDCSVCFNERDDIENLYKDINHVQSTGLNLLINYNSRKTYIHFIANKEICDGWSIILFFKSLAQCYTSFLNNLPLPDISYAKSNESLRNLASLVQQQSLTTFSAQTINTSIAIEKIPENMQKKLFSHLLMLFDKSLKEMSTKSDETIFVPMAGQLLTRNLKVFDNCTFYFKYSEKEIPDLTSPINTQFCVDKIETKLNKAKYHLEGIYNKPKSNDIIFNMDNLNFDLDFNNCIAKLVVKKEEVTNYKIVCNISKLNESLEVTLKYAPELISEQEANNLLDTFTYNIVHHYENI